MNEHEIDRIACAVHVLRPDWPVASIRTLVTKNLADRPRRDVCVALAWIACESNTATPARVLETGPWWRAAGVEGRATNAPPKYTPGSLCQTCGHPRERCEAVRWDGDDHAFEPFAKPSGGSAVDELRDIKATATRSDHQEDQR